MGAHSTGGYVLTMPVRDATERDLDEIVALITELADYEDLRDDVVLDRDTVGGHLFGPEPAAHVLVAETDTGEVAGFALWFTSFSTFLGRPGIWLEDLFIRPPFRNRGFGLALLNRLRALTDGRIEWNVLDWNESAIGFYRSLGAKPVDGWTTYRWLP
jgi:GNAT superfamily N-acetyltransferase